MCGVYVYVCVFVSVYGECVYMYMCVYIIVCCMCMYVLCVCMCGFMDMWPVPCGGADPSVAHEDNLRQP
jgi:hypothetical protein